MKTHFKAPVTAPLQNSSTAAITASKILVSCLSPIATPEANLAKTTLCV